MVTCILGAISGSTYVTFVDVTRSLIKGKLDTQVSFVLVSCSLAKENSIDFYTQTCLTKYHFPVDPFVVTNQGPTAVVLRTIKIREFTAEVCI